MGVTVALRQWNDLASYITEVHIEVVVFNCRREVSFIDSIMTGIHSLVYNLDLTNLVGGNYSSKCLFI